MNESDFSVFLLNAILSRKVWKHANTQHLSTKETVLVSKGNRYSLENVPFTLSSKYTMNEINSFYETKRNMERRITSLQSQVLIVIFLDSVLQTKKVSFVTRHEVRNIVAGASLLITTAQFGNTWLVNLTFFDIKVSNEASECYSE